MITFKWSNTFALNLMVDYTINIRRYQHNFIHQFKVIKNKGDPILSLECNVQRY